MAFAPWRMHPLADAVTEPFKVFPGGTGQLPQGQEPLLVIGLVGGEVSGPAPVANRLLDVPVFPLPGEARKTPQARKAAQHGEGTEAEIWMHVDHKHGVAIAVLSSPTCGARLLDQAARLFAADSEAAVHTWLTEPTSERALLVLFHLCHVVLHVSNARCADVRWLRTLRVLTTLKQNLHPAVLAALKPLANQLPLNRAGQPSQLPPQPSLGFLFAPQGGPLAKSASSQLQGALEAQVRRMLASSKLLARGAAGGPGALYTLPKEPTQCVHVVHDPRCRTMPSAAQVASRLLLLSLSRLALSRLALSRLALSRLARPARTHHAGLDAPLRPSVHPPIHPPTYPIHPSTYPTRMPRTPSLLLAC